MGGLVTSSNQSISNLSRMFANQHISLSIMIHLQVKASSDWLPNFGATGHMVNATSCFLEITCIKSTIAQLPNDASIVVTHKETLSLTKAVVFTRCFTHSIIFCQNDV